MLGHLDNYYCSVIFLQLIVFIESLTIMMQLKPVCSWDPKDKYLSAQSISQQLHPSVHSGPSGWSLGMEPFENCSCLLPHTPDHMWDDVSQQLTSKG